MRKRECAYAAVRVKGNAEPLCVNSIISAVLGAIIYRFVLAAALKIGMEAIDLKLFSAIIVAAAIFIPDVIKLFRKKKKEAA